MKKLYWSIFLLPVIFFACNSETGSVDTQPEELQEVFVAQPIRLDAREVTTLAPGASAPDFNLPGVDGQFYSLANFESSKALCIIFTCNHCPTAQAYEERMMQISKDYDDASLALVAISPNSEISLLDEECGYTELRDSYEEMKIRSDYQKFNFPYLYDGDDHAVSLQYGPVATPHAFLFDAERKLAYVGRLDTSEKPGTANAEDLRAAIDAVLAGEAPAEASTKTFGCSVKWSWKDEWKEKTNEEWAAKPVTLESIDEAGVKALLANDSEKLRLINIWATWCGPCKIEYPEFIRIHRMFYGRDFEFVSITSDDLSKKDNALEFLQSKESGVKNYIFSGKDKYSLIEAVDPNWNGALPYTILVEPGGKVVYSVQNTIDPLELKRTIVEHPMIGRYF